MTLIESECQADQLEEDIYEDCYILGSEHEPATFDLFVQWLYTRKYQEKEGLAESLVTWELPASLESVTPQDLRLVTDGVMDGAVKAAILCWELGASLGAKGFQNYTMERLFEALSRPLAQPLTVNAILHTFDVKNEENYHGKSPLQRLIQDVIARNWGDDAVVQHTDQELWSHVLEFCPYFRSVMIEATRHTLEKRRELGLSLENYLIQ